MSEYTYTGIGKNGQKVTGTINAPTEGELRMMLRNQGIRPTRIMRAAGKQGGKKSGGGFFGGGPSVPGEVLLIFTRQLYVLVSSGIPLIQAIETLADQANHPGLRTILVSVKEKVAGGSYFWEALSGYPKGFSKLYVSLVRAGESSGALDEMLRRLTGYLEDANRLRKLLKSAMIYPIAVVCVGIAVIAAMLIFVIPKFEELLKSSGQELPAVTQAVIDISHFMVENILPISGGTFITIWTIVKYVQSPEGKAFVDRMFFRFPLFGPLMQKGAVARFARTMQTLLASGVSLLDAIDICKATIDNAVVEQQVAKIRGEVEAGNRLGTVINKMDAFPKMAVQMISVGEASGALDQMLEKVADFYEAEVESMVAGLSKLIEPFILVFLGGAVGGLLIAMYMPIFKMAGGVGGE